MRRVTTAGGPVSLDPRVLVYEVTAEGVCVTHPRVAASLVVPLGDTRSVGELERDVGELLGLRFEVPVMLGGDRTPSFGLRAP